jgi:hypothetical protein
LGGREFACTETTVSVPSGFEDPASCALLDTRVKREFCDDGSTRYTFIEGEENVYELDVDADGTATYFSAFGYVGPACGLDANDFDFGSTQSGQRSDVQCSNGCALCDDYDGLPICQTCERDPNDPHTVQQPLDEYCARAFCPKSIAEARALLDGPCSAINQDQIRTGCGLVWVESIGGYSVTSYVFDAQSGALQGVLLEDDVPFGQCDAWTYRIGTVSDVPCSEMTACKVCTSSSTGEAGAGGAAGTAGAASDGLCGP